MALTAADIPFQSVMTAPETYRLLDDVELMLRPDPQFLIAGIVPVNAVVVVYGPSGSGKSTLMAGLVTALATGDLWFGHPVCQRGASIYVATEDCSGWKVRLRAAKLAARLSLDVPIGCYTFPEPIDLRDAISVGRFTRFLQDSGGRFELLVVDTYASATPGASENSSEDTTLAMSHAQQWRDALNLTVVLVHRERHDD